MTSAPDPFEALYEELEATGDWYRSTPEGLDGVGRLMVEREVPGGYVHEVEVLRAFDGRGWVIYADSFCPTCWVEFLITQRLQGTEVDIVAAVNQAGRQLGAPTHQTDQHHPACPQAAEETAPEPAGTLRTTRCNS